LTPSKPVYDAICTAFDVVPEGCLLKDTVTVWVSVTDHPGWVVFLVIAIILLLMGTVLYVYKRILKKDMDKELSLQVNSAISQYFALGDRSKTSGSDNELNSVGGRGASLPK